jgi:hypothetical protein
MSKRIVLSCAVSAVLALAACGSNSATKYCDVKADCDGSSSSECATAAGYNDLAASCQIDADLYYDCLSKNGTCANKVFTPDPKCESYAAVLYSCKTRSDAGTAK